MTRNMGTADRVVRGLLLGPAAAIAAVALGPASVAGVALLTLAAIMVATAAVGFCPLYALFGVHTGGRRHVAHG